jgi:ribosomal protein L34E
MSMHQTYQKRLDLCADHKQEWKQSEYAKHNCDYCKLEIKLLVAEKKNAELLSSMKDIHENARRLGSVFCECVAENAINKAVAFIESGKSLETITIPQAGVK